jgi:hypothetical protein
MANAKRDTNNVNQHRATVAPTGSSIGSPQGYLGGASDSAPPDSTHRSASDVVARPTSDMPNAPSGIFPVAQKDGGSVLLAAAHDADAVRDRVLFAAAMGDALDDILRAEIA